MVGVAQLAERLVVVQEVAGSTPSLTLTKDGIDLPPNHKGRTGYPVRPLFVSHHCRLKSALHQRIHLT